MYRNKGWKDRRGNEVEWEVGDLIDEWAMEKDAFASFTHNLLLILRLCTTTQFDLVCLYECALLTCLGILCRRIDEVQSTWTQCRGKGCLALSASWAKRMGKKNWN